MRPRIRQRRSDHLGSSAKLVGASLQLDRGSKYEMILNAQEIENPSSLIGRNFLRHCNCSVPLKCPAVLVDIHARSEAGGRKSCDLLAGGYRFDKAWGTANLPVQVRSWGEKPMVRAQEHMGEQHTGEPVAGKKEHAAAPEAADPRLTSAPTKDKPKEKPHEVM